jgi:hypothetical protein
VRIVDEEVPDELVERLGVVISAHDLRRTYATVAESSGISPLELKALLNHSLGDDVTSGYVQMTVERLREPAQRVADSLKELCGLGAPEGASDAPLLRAVERNRPSRLRAALRGPRCGLGRSARYGDRGRGAAPIGSRRFWLSTPANSNFWNLAEKVRCAMFREGGWPRELSRNLGDDD